MEELHHWWEFGKSPKLTTEDEMSLPNPSRQSSKKQKYEAMSTGAPLDLNINKIGNNGNGDRNNNFEEVRHNEVNKDIVHLIPKICLFIWL